jgi:hypothetical protein
MGTCEINHVHGDAATVRAVCVILCDIGNRASFAKARERSMDRGKQYAVPEISMSQTFEEAWKRAFRRCEFNTGSAEESTQTI